MEDKELHLYSYSSFRLMGFQLSKGASLIETDRNEHVS